MLIQTLIHELTTVVPLWFYPAALMVATILVVPIGLYITRDWTE